MHIILNERTIRQMAFKKKTVAPVPLSLLVHLLGFCLLAFLACWYGVSEKADVDQPVEIELAVNMSDSNAGAVVNTVGEQAAGGGQAPLSTKEVAAAGGGQAPLSAKEAVATGDGAVAAGAGNSQRAEDGQSFAQGMAGEGTGGGAGSDMNIASGKGSSAGSGSGQGAATENISDIAARFAARVEANKKFPHMAMKRNQQGVVFVYATIATGGSLVECGISSSSGIDSLDRAALQAVERSCPFPHGAGHAVTFTVPIHFELY